MGDINNPKQLDNKNELIAFSLKTLLEFLKKHWWKLSLVVLSIGLASGLFLLIYELVKGAIK